MRIIIEGGPREGKSSVAYFISTVLKGLGALIILNDEAHSDTWKKGVPEALEKIMKGKRVEIKTVQLPRT